VDQVTVRVVGVEPRASRDRRVDLPVPGRHVVRGDERVGLRVVPLLVDEPERVEDLHRLMGIERRHDLGDRVEVPVDELAETAVVVDRACAGAALDEQLEGGDAERVLDVDGDEADPHRVLRRRPQAVLRGPQLGLARAVVVGHPPDLAHGLRVEMWRNRQHPWPV
jgi:hypothetical protein